MSDEKERRKGEDATLSGLRAELNEAQRMTLSEMERFGWELKFIRRPLFQPSIPVVFDSERKRFAVIELDGTLNEHPDFEIRG
jgi:hypothetical protein